MSVRIRVEPIDRDVAMLLQENLSPAARSRTLAEYAGEQIREAAQINRSILGRVPPYTVAVDGRMGAALESVHPDGVIFAEFELISDVLGWIGEQLVRHSPVKTGRYQRSHVVFADGVEIEVGKRIPAAQEYVFLSTVVYARKIELGSSSQAPDGVYQVVAKLARQRFNNVARISFSYRTAISGAIIGGHQGNRSAMRQPAVIVSIGGR